MHRFMLLATTLLASSWASASGQLDPRFDHDGVLVEEISFDTGGDDLLEAGLIDHVGRYVGAGHGRLVMGPVAAVIRTHPGGRLDGSFGNEGIARLPRLDGYSVSTMVDIAEQPDGKLVVAGYAAPALGIGNNSRAYVCRLLESGSMDLAFGGDGCIAPPFWFESNNDDVHAMVLQSDGRIVLLGTTDIDGVGAREPVVARLESDGSFDTCFGDITCQAGGLVFDPEGNALTGYNVNALALAPDGRIVIAGSANGVNVVSRDMVAVRLTPTGDVDQSFGDGGHRLVAFNLGSQNSDIAHRVVVRNDGSILLVGEAQDDFAVLVGVAALNANGNLIGSFGSGGRSVLFFNDVSPVHRATRAMLQGDGKLLLTGYTINDSEPNVPADCGIARLLPNGQPDLVFGIDGKLNIDGGLGLEDPRSDACHGIAARNGSIVLFGSRQPVGSDDDEALMIKLDEDDQFRDGFEP